MDKTKPDQALSGGRPIAKKIVAKMKRHRRGKVVDIKNWIDGRATAEELHKEISAQKELAALDPAFAAYVYPQIQVSLMSEQLTELKEMAPFADIVSKAEDLYMPEGPPMSPLTRSYFSCWALFDACVGPAYETIGTTILEIGTSFGMHAELLRLIRQMQESRMGFYIYCGRKGKLTVLEDIVTGAVCRAIVPSVFSPEVWRHISQSLEDMGRGRIAEMDRGGVEFSSSRSLHPASRPFLMFSRSTLPGLGESLPAQKYAGR